MPILLSRASELFWETVEYLDEIWDFRLCHEHLLWGWETEEMDSLGTHCFSNGTLQ